MGVSNASPASGTGRIGFLNAGQRYAASTWPKGDQKFFDSSATMYEEIPSGTPGPGQILLPTVDQFPTYPCTNCPSSGAPAPS